MIRWSVTRGSLDVWENIMKVNRDWAGKDGGNQLTGNSLESIQKMVWPTRTALSFEFKRPIRFGMHLRRTGFFSK